MPAKQPWKLWKY